jgi:hypothetical protein
LAPAEYQGAIEVIDLFEIYACRNPRMAGDEHSELPGLWVFETPSALSRLPRLALVYGIDDDDGYVTLCNLYRL